MIVPDHENVVPTHPSDLFEVVCFRDPQLLDRDGETFVLPLPNIRKTT